MRAINVIYQSVKERLPITVEQFAEALKDWEFVELEQESELIGAVMLKDNEIHVGYSQKPKGSIRKHISQTLKKVIDEYGSAVTTVAESNERGLRFCNRLGFVEINREQGKIYLKCDRCKYD